ncbi:hypothetical protein PC129_g16135 [Phytophthora cactorum]|uniref:Uncharacterized protein n=1 Tax=Phytophthora cactorum TaxID=29920 RepID=A0A8T0Z6J9_9STRA|nr:hypothetical protein Pcac1_g18131 [Phytophthora cactorum]KAG2811811.1 hypothetical protein PC112_g15449 [Phytophthora cactorum]KAG2857691.1 hypothetical protein PC113_g10473 [Phytophthora cactorum]KAG2912449.1 hypothetical protein PC117_g18899 [Phytophthora cactorum]KAG3006813.1 hypothetical protein PC120_g17136 [Phytophthora cactorum]
MPPVHLSLRTKPLCGHQGGRHDRRQAAGPYARGHPQEDRSVLGPRGSMRASTQFARRPRSSASRARDLFVPARWPCRLVHLREQFNPLATVFPTVTHFGWCDCSAPCRVGSCRNALTNLFCSVNYCPSDGKCGNGLVASAKLYLGRNARTSELCVGCCKGH